MSTQDVLPKDNAGYQSKEYWDERYAKEDTFDWFRKYSDVANELRQYILNKNASILMLGCGNSTLSQDMYTDGYKNIVNIDYSGVCIEKMQSKHPHMTWIEGDVRHLPLESASFDVAIDKGTMDAFMTAKGDVWDPPQEIVQSCNQEVDEAIRVLKPDGMFLIITFGQPHFRKRYFTRPNTTLQVIELKTQGFSYFLYVVTKVP